MRKKLLLALLGAALALGAGEAASRLLLPDPAELGAYPRIYRPSAFLPWELNPGARDSLARPDDPEFGCELAINSLGYREREFNLQKPAGTYRVLFLGDSFIVGWGVPAEEVVTRVLEGLLREQAPGRALEVINAGFAAGYSPDTYCAYLRARGLELQPDLVICAFLPRNDLDDLTRKNEQVHDPSGALVGVRSRIEAVDPEHRRRSIARRSWLQEVRRQSRLCALLAGAARTLSPASRGREAIEFLRRDDGEDYRRGWELAGRYLGECRSLIQSRAPGARFLVVAIPDALQVHRESWGALGLPFDGELFEAGYPEAKAAALARAQGLELLALLPELRRRGEAERLYFRRDGHWNAAGHRAAAEVIARFLGERKWIP